MGKDSKIEWTDSTWNPVVGCSLVSPGCTNCYAMRTAQRLERLGLAKYAGLTREANGKPVWTGTVRLDEKTLTDPLRWQSPERIFVNSMSDLFHEALPDEAIDRVFAVMALSPQHTFQVLTKRSDRMRAYLKRGVARWKRLDHDPWSAIAVNLTGSPCAAGALEERPWPLPNVWLGVSVEDQARADERIPLLLETPAAKRFLSCEPLLGPVDLRPPVHDALLAGRVAQNGGDGTRPIDWVIVGGESGPGARPMHPDWARSLRDQCQRAEVPFFFKQWGEWHTAAHLASTGEAVFREFSSFDHWVAKASTWVNGGICLDREGRELRRGADFMRARDEGKFPVTIMHRTGKKSAGRLLDGRTWDELPA